MNACSKAYRSHKIKFQHQLVENLRFIRPVVGHVPSPRRPQHEGGQHGNAWDCNSSVARRDTAKL